MGGWVGGWGEGTYQPTGVAGLLPAPGGSLGGLVVGPSFFLLGNVVVHGGGGLGGVPPFLVLPSFAVVFLLLVLYWCV